MTFLEFILQFSKKKKKKKVKFKNSFFNFSNKKWKDKFKFSINKNGIFMQTGSTAEAGNKLREVCCFVVGWPCLEKHLFFNYWKLQISSHFYLENWKLND